MTSEVAGRGRVIVSWSRFERVDFAAPAASGSGRGFYAPGEELTGSVTTTDGSVRRGRLVWDLDEGWTWDIFNGGEDGVEYEIPFALIAAVERRNDGCRVFLRGGDALDLDAGQDASAANRGLLSEDCPPEEVRAFGDEIRDVLRRVAVIDSLATRRWAGH